MATTAAVIDAMEAWLGAIDQEQTALEVSGP
jgi:hypothetical protein